MHLVYPFTVWRVTALTQTNNPALQDPEDPDSATVDTEYVVGEFNCSCVDVSKFQAVCGGSKTLADVPDEDYFDACQLTDLMGIKAIEMISKKKGL